MLAILTTHPIQYQVPLWQALAKEGSVPFEVWYLTRHGVEPSPDAEFKKSFSWDLNLLEGYPYEFIQTNPNPKVHRFWGVRLRGDLKKRFREKGVKALWIQGWQVFAYWQAVWQAHEAGIEVWVRGESNDLAPVPFWKKLPKKILLRAFFRRINHFLYIGEANRRLYGKYGVSRGKLHFAPYCVDNERFMRQAEELRPKRDEIRREWKIPGEAFCILFAGKFIPKKRPLDIVHAVSNGQLNHSRRPLHLLFAGSGELGGKLRQQCNVVFDMESENAPSLRGGIPLIRHPEEARRAAEGSRDPSATSSPQDDAKRQIASASVGTLPRNDNPGPPASFVGFLNQTEISKAYVAADCLVLPSDYRETWGLVVNEAMASGLPCVVSDACGSCEDLVESLNPKLRFQPASHESLAEALFFLMKTPISRQTLQKHVTKFGIGHTIETIRHVILTKG